MLGLPVSVILNSINSVSRYLHQCNVTRDVISVGGDVTDTAALPVCYLDSQ